MQFIKEKVDNMCFKMVDKLFQSISRGELTFTFPDGSKKVYSGIDKEIVANATINDNTFFWKCVLFGSLGLGEAYVDGDWDTDDIEKVISLVILNINNNTDYDKKKSSVNYMNILNKVNYWLRANTKRGSKENIADHYDLGNDFFKSFLDKSMTYSSAYFEKSEQSLQEAQKAKYARLCEKLKLNPNDHVLEIGSGWGGFAEYAAKNYGCKVTTTTISQEQFDYARALVKKEGLEERVNVVLKDYRELTGKYDKIVSIEMIEAVGHKFIKDYFQKCHELLKEDGLLGLQMILFPDRRYDISKNSVDFIQKHIFPGSLLPSLKSVHDAIYQTGNLNLYHYEDITSHYVKTLQTWRDNFNSKAKDILKLGKNQAFIRKWNYYFAYCAAAFAMRHISVAQAIFSRSNNRNLHDDLEVTLSSNDQEMLQRISDNMINRGEYDKI